MMVPSSLPYWLNSQEGLSWPIIWVVHSVCRMFVCALTETSNGLLSQALHPGYFKAYQV